MVHTKETFLVELDDLFQGKDFLEINEQLLFKKANRYFMTCFAPDQNYSVKDYMKLPEGAPYQLIQSKLIYMPSPTTVHQKISMKLSFEVFNYLKNKDLGEVLTAPMDVHFDDQNIYQPDLLFVRKNRANIIQQFVHGAPDWVVEILSKRTEAKDRQEKKMTYQKYGVQEYWLINPDNQTIEVFVLKNQILESQGIFTKTDEIQSVVIDGFRLSLTSIFD